jgi:hypothetical protein
MLLVVLVWFRVLDALEYGSSSDYVCSTSRTVSKAEAMAATTAAEGGGLLTGPSQHSQEKVKDAMKAVNGTKRGSDGSKGRFAGWEAHLSGGRMPPAVAGVGESPWQREGSWQQQQLAGAGAGAGL